ncbi:MAG TPA: hypothetical protein VKE51_40445 [Vicinamibacterales bacterium]|nr:hypothetical protein [Vicinamibacterales bacterium]
MWTIKPTVNAPASTGSERQARHQIRNELADLIASGRVFQNSVVNAGSGIQREQAMALVSSVSDWHTRVLRFTEKQISHADAMRLIIPATTGHYPRGIEKTILFDGGKSGVALMPSWDLLSSDLAALESFLAARPEL